MARLRKIEISTDNVGEKKANVKRNLLSCYLRFDARRF